LTQPVSSQPDQPEQHHQAQPLPNKHEERVSHTSIFALLALVGLLLILFTGLLIGNLPQVTQPDGTQQTLTKQGTALATSTVTPTPLLAPGGNAAASLQFPAGHAVVYETQDNKIYVTSANGSLPQLVNTPGYSYNSAVVPILTPSGDLLYSGDSGVWSTGIFGGTAKQIVTFPADQVITSLALSRDGSMLAWSTEPQNGVGSVKLYAGSLSDAMVSPLGEAALVYQQPAEDCPCLRVFSFLGGSGKQADNTLLLTDDRGDHRAVRYGLWSFDLGQRDSAQPQPLLAEEEQQGPLALAPEGNMLLYSSYEGVVPAPTDGSTPEDIDALSYANSLYVAPIGGKPLVLNPAQVILPAQHELSNSAEYHWVATPLFSPDGHTLIYVEFSSDALAPFSRHSALYTVQMKGVGGQLRAGNPQLLATTTAQYIEPGTESGAWLDNSTLTFYADRALYAVNIHTGAVASIAQTETYARVLAVVKQEGLKGPEKSSVV